MRRFIYYMLFSLVAHLGLSAAEIFVPKDAETIQQAIDIANPGDVITISKGVYRERLKLKPNITIRSAGDDTLGQQGLKRAEATIINGAGNAGTAPGVTMAEGSRLDGLTVTQVGTFDQAEFDKHHASRGENLPDNQGATGLAGSLPAIDLTGVTATVTNCLVHDNGHVGIGCSSVPGGRNHSKIVSNVVYRNMGGGIGVALAAEPLVKGNRCFHNLRAGIGCRAARGILIKNECYENVRAGIGIREGAKPIVRENRCYKNRRAGIGNRMAGTSPHIEKNICFRNGMAGIGTRNEASPLIQNNHCYENRLAGIGCSANCRPIIIGNRLHDNLAAAIGFEACEKGVAVVSDNEIVAKDLVAVGIQKGWEVRLSANKIKRIGGMPPLVMLFSGAQAEFTNNEFTGSGVAGVRVGGIARLSGNTFICPNPRAAGPPQFAIWALANSEVVVAENEVKGWRQELVADPKAKVADHRVEK